MVIRKIMALLLLLPFVLYCPDEEATKEPAGTKSKPGLEETHDNGTREDRCKNRTEDSIHCSKKEPE